MAKALTVAVVGSTGAVGQELLSILESRNFPATGKGSCFGTLRRKGHSL